MVTDVTADLCLQVRFEDAKTVKLEDGRMVTEFDARSTAERIWVLAGGVLANVAVAWSSLLAGALVAGVPTKDLLPGIRISAVDDEAFARTGLKAADVLLRIGGLDLNFSGAEVRQTVAFINQLPAGRPVEMLVQRGTEEVLLTANTITDPNTGLQRLGVMIETNSQRVLAKAEGFSEAAGVATDVLTKLLDEQVKALEGLFTGMGPGEMVGPVGIVKQGEDLMAAEGLLGIFIFFVTVNLNLAFINALPLPALDGGKALFVLAEQVSGQRLDENKKQDVELAFLLLVVLGLGSVTIKDVGHLFESK
ncbi:ARASP [Symbiodinium sp. CCMP2456]|nr:ARASP [Symbiodinium sp. CCMP2456]